jgi:hypothetical protein
MIYVVMGGDDVGSTLRSRERHDNSRVRRFFLSVLVVKFMSVVDSQGATSVHITFMVNGLVRPQVTMSYTVKSLY